MLWQSNNLNSEKNTFLDARNNLLLLPKTGAEDSDELIYFTAAVVIIYNPTKQYQRHYLEHTDDIKW